MVSSFVPLVAALSTGHKLGLLFVGLAFIAFALVSSFVLPGRNPNFPGRGIGWFVVVSVLFFIAMISAVIVLGREPKEAAGAGEKTTTSAQPAPPAAPSGGAGHAQGDAAAGKQVFSSAGCSGCHTLKAAGATGTVGPNLDQLKPAEPIIVHQVENGGGAMPAFKGSLSQQQIQNVAAFVYTSTH